MRQLLSEIEGYVRCQEYATYRMLTATARGEEMKAMLPMMMIKLLLHRHVMKLVIARSPTISSAATGCSTPNEAENDSIYDTLPLSTRRRRCNN